MTKRNVAIVGSGMTNFSQRLREVGKETCFDAVRIVLDEPPSDLEVRYWSAPVPFRGYHDPEVDSVQDVGSEEISLTMESQPVSENRPKKVADSFIWIRGTSSTCWLEQGDWSRTVYTKLTSEDTYKMVTTRGLFSEGCVSANSSFPIIASDRSAIFAILIDISRLRRTLDTMLRLKEQAGSQQRDCKIAIRVLERDTHN